MVLSIAGHDWLVLIVVRRALSVRRYADRALDLYPLDTWNQLPELGNYTPLQCACALIVIVLWCK